MTTLWGGQSLGSMLSIFYARIPINLTNKNMYLHNINFKENEMINVATSVFFDLK